MLVSPKHKALLLSVRNPASILAMLPKAKTLQFKRRKLVALPHTLNTVRTLNATGIRAPSPILHYYEWPRSHSIKNPFVAQAQTAAFLTLYDRGYILNGLGSGKTIASLWAYDYLRSKGRAKKLLVIAPLSTVDLTWADAIFEHFPHLNCTVLHHSTRAKRIKMLDIDADVYVTNHDGAKILWEEINKRPEIDTIIVDELAQCARNAQTDMWKAINLIVNAPKLNRRAWGLTATPMPNSPTDVFGQAKLLTPNTVPRYFTRFRDTVMRQQGPYLWLPRANATETAHAALQPSIRYSREECVDLPPTTYTERHVDLSKPQEKAYKEMLSRLRAEVAEGKITAANEAVKAGKLIQIACIAHGTDVLTDVGWVPIQQVTAAHRVWDGEEWVGQAGAVCFGEKATVVLDGVHMTPDHKVWVGEWVTAQEILDADASSRFDRPEVRLPDRGGAKRVYQWANQMRTLAMPMRLRTAGHAHEPVPALEAPHTPTQLWVPPRQRNTQDVRWPTVSGMDTHAATVHRPELPGLGELWRAGHHGVSSVARIVRGVLGRYAGRILAASDAGAHRQRRRVRPGELPVGDRTTAKQQQAVERNNRHPEGSDDAGASSACVQYQANHTAGADQTVRVVGGARTAYVYDLVSCGPRSRFVVRGVDGQLLIVHNCGIAYTDQKETISFPCKSRLAEVEDLIQESNSKTIVFAPFVSVVNMLADHLRASGYSTEVIYGDVSKTKRHEVFSAFQRSALPQVIVAQPSAMSHGLTLTAASTIIWYAPITSADTYGQANGRITRPGQAHNTLIVHISSTAEERKMYNRLKNKERMQGILLDMVVQSRAA